ncbi:MAG: killer suppression protein [Candidatus Sumerlaeota bacterium]|nr:killer suppression protein [Candidatus Sumerlaeota bacterium]
MEIAYENGQIRKEIARLQKKPGQLRARLIDRRIAELRAAATLKDLENLPGPRLHQWKRKPGQKKAVFSVDLDHPYRLLFQVEGDEPQLAGGGVDWQKVIAIELVSIDDPH